MAKKKSRFVNPKNRDVDVLWLNEEEWVSVKRRLTNGERRHIEAAGIVMKQTRKHVMEAKAKGEEPDADIGIDLESFQFEKVFTYLNGWNLTDDDDNPVQYNRSNLEMLDDETFAQISKLLDEYTEIRAQEKNGSAPVMAPATPGPSETT